MTNLDQLARVAVDELGLKPGMRVRMTGGVGPELKSAAKARIAGSLLRSGELDMIVRLVRSIDEADEFLGRVRGQIVNDGTVWLVTWKPDDPRHISRKDLIPVAKRHRLRADRECVIDDRRQAIRFVIA
ncbi:MAG: hypothetical protein HZB14_08825 [Actinobacteria bacterium]|nr:hypothetical protein [Actinomycetota bacterium]